MPAPSQDGKFPTTQWTLVSRIRSRSESVARQALDDLCAQYHYPLYCYIRRRGLSHHDAQDALHDFFAKLLRLGVLHRTAPDGGRLRGFLSTSLQRFLINWHRDHAKERLLDSLEAGRELAAAEERFERERLTDDDTPESIFERKWAHELLRQVQSRLHELYRERDREAVFLALLPSLQAGGTMRGEDGSGIAVRLGMSPGALRVAMSRLLDDYRTELRHAVRQTVEHDEDVEEELAALINVFQRR